MPKEALQCIKTIKKDQKTSKKGQKTIKARFKGALSIKGGFFGILCNFFWGGDTSYSVQLFSRFSTKRRQQHGKSIRNATAYSPTPNKKY